MLFSSKKSIYFRINPDAENPSDICLKIGLESVEDIVGTFKNGTLQGPAKIKFYNGAKIIANFKDGHFFGLRRDWLPNGKMVQAAYYNKFIMSKSWKKIGNYLAVVDSAKIKSNKENQMEFVIDLKTLKAYVGSLKNLTKVTFLEDVYEVDLLDQPSKVL